MFVAGMYIIVYGYLTIIKQLRYTYLVAGFFIRKAVYCSRGIIER